MSYKVAIHHILNISPSILVSQRDMIINKPFITDLLQQHINIDEKLQFANLHHFTFDYQPGDEILILTTIPIIFQDSGIVPFTITQVHTNGYRSTVLGE